jgi:hypothetical protein
VSSVVSVFFLHMMLLLSRWGSARLAVKRSFSEKSKREAMSEWKTNRRSKTKFPVQTYMEGDTVVLTSRSRRKGDARFHRGPADAISDRYMGSVENKSGKELTEEQKKIITAVLKGLGITDEDDLYPQGFDDASRWAYDFYVYGHGRARDVFHSLNNALKDEGLKADIDFDTEEDDFRREEASFS